MLKFCLRAGCSFSLIFFAGSKFQSGLIFGSLFRLVFEGKNLRGLRRIRDRVCGFFVQGVIFGAVNFGGSILSVILIFSKNIIFCVF